MIFIDYFKEMMTRFLEKLSSGLFCGLNTLILIGAVIYRRESISSKLSSLNVAEYS